MEDNSTAGSANASGIFILGMHRSGTSALTRVLNLMGPELPDDVLTADKYNSKGYWESNAVVQLNDRILNHFDKSWKTPSPMPQRWFGQAATQNFIAEAKELIRREFSLSTDFLIKDPRLSRTLPVWRAALSDIETPMVCLIAIRHPEEVCRSLMLRNNMSREHAYGLWTRYMVEAESHTRNMNCAFISYHRLLSNWHDTLAAAFDTARLYKYLEALKNNTTVGTFLCKDMQHNVIDQDSYVARSSASTAAMEVYERLTQANSRVFI